ncbi:DUF6342 family protein [Streptosporangium canum]|uniref:DUF6342 family protein n=1 Tax=Streptosporangium canum TaxID=324952 RepID=UPI0034124AC7
MPDVDLGLATDWNDGDTHGRVKLRDNQQYPNTPKRDVMISSPMNIEISVNTDLTTTPAADKVYFSTYYGEQKKIIAILDADGNLYLVGKLTQNVYGLGY